MSLTKIPLFSEPGRALMQTALGVTVPGRHPSTSLLQGREPGKPERQPENYYGIRICHSPVKPWGLGTDKLQGCAISGGAKPWQAACPLAGEASAEQFCQPAHTGIGTENFQDHWAWAWIAWWTLPKIYTLESVPGLGLWDSPGGFFPSHKTRVSMQPAWNSGIVFLDWLEVHSRSCKWNNWKPVNQFSPV